jgi:serine protease Do
MNRNLKTLLILFLASLGCRQVAESQTVEPPVQAAAPIPASVGASRRTPVVVVAHNVLPSVVNIQSEATIRRRETDPFFDPFGFFGGRDRVYSSQSLGSGFVWAADGVIVTNSHVVEGASRITVVFHDGSQMAAKLVGVDPDSDLAVLKVDARNLPVAPVGTSADLLIGESVVAVGNPFGLSGTVTTGVLSATGRSVPSKEQGRTFTDFLQTDASINPGNSGGPLLNIEGKVIGINTAIYAQAQGIGFAIPVDRARKVVQDLMRFGQVHSAWIGAVTATLTPEEAKRTGLLTQRGAVVTRIFGGSPAERAGLETGDVILSVGNTPIDSRESFSTQTATALSGSPVTLKVNRAGKTLDVSVRPTEPPSNIGLTILRAISGIGVKDEGRNIVIDSVADGSRAAEIGLAPGDYIVGVNGSEVHDTKQLNDELTRSAERASIALTVARGRYAYNLTFPMSL